MAAIAAAARTAVVVSIRNRAAVTEGSSQRGRVASRTSGAGALLTLATGCGTMAPVRHSRAGNEDDGVGTSRTLVCRRRARVTNNAAPTKPSVIGSTTTSNVVVDPRSGTPNSAASGLAPLDGATMPPAAGIVGDAVAVAVAVADGVRLAVAVGAGLANGLGERLGVGVAVASG